MPAQNPAKTISVKVSLPSQNLNPQGFITEMFPIVDGSAAFDMMCGCVPAPESLCFAQGDPGATSPTIEFCPSPADAMSSVKQDAAIVIVDLVLGRDCGLLDPRSLFCVSLECLMEQMSDTPESLLPVIGGDRPCGAFLALQRQDEMLEGVGWQVSVARIAKKERSHGE